MGHRTHPPPFPATPDDQYVPSVKQLTGGVVLETARHRETATSRNRSTGKMSRSFRKRQNRRRVLAGAVPESKENDLTSSKSQQAPSCNPLWRIPPSCPPPAGIFAEKRDLFASIATRPWCLEGGDIRPVRGPAAPRLRVPGAYPAHRRQRSWSEMPAPGAIATTSVRPERKLVPWKSRRSKR